MNNLEQLLRKYANNFLLSDNIINYNKIEYLNFHNIVTVTDINLIRVSSIKKNDEKELHLQVSNKIIDF